MRKVVSLAVIILFVASTILVFAASDNSKPKCCGVVLPFQIMADSMKVGKAKQKNQLIPLECTKKSSVQDAYNAMQQPPAMAETTK